MMRIFIGTLFLISVLLIALPIPHITGQSDIIVDNADTRRDITTGAPSANLDVQARVAVQYGNSLHHLTVGSLPAPFQALLDGVAQRVSAQYANSIRHVNMVSLPEPFQAILSTAAARIGFQYANSNRHLTLVYPRALLNDTVPPVIGPIAPSSNAGSATISWSTDEFTRYTLRYGTQSGNYTQAVEEPLFAKQHTVTLSDLVSGSTYYLQVTAFDLSGNQTVSPELSFIVGPTPTPTSNPTVPPPLTPTTNPVFLPLVDR